MEGSIKYVETSGRAPFQVLVIPVKGPVNNIFSYAVFKRADRDIWQWISGGGEGSETPAEAARRESLEEAGIPAFAPIVKLESMVTMPATVINGTLMWGTDILVIPEYAFAVDCSSLDVHYSNEHTEIKWVGYEEARNLLEFESNRNALWELDYRLQNQSSFWQG